MNVKPKNIDRLNKVSKDNNERERAIAKEWLAFSKTSAYQDLMDYGHTTSEMLTSYAKERVMPSPIEDGAQVIIDGETSISLLQNSRGCDIILSYIEEYVSSSTNK